MKIELPEQFVKGSDLSGSPTHLELLGDRLGLKTEAGKVALTYALRQIILLDRKQLDYGPKNISDFGVFGVVVRMNDKMQRLKTLVGNKRLKPQNESIKDSLQDISNYGIIGQMIEDRAWPV